MPSGPQPSSPSVVPQPTAVPLVALSTEPDAPIGSRVAVPLEPPKIISPAVVIGLAPSAIRFQLEPSTGVTPLIPPVLTATHEEPPYDTTSSAV